MEGQSVETLVSRDPCGPRQKRHVQCLLELLRVFNGKLHLPPWHHDCMHPSCCYRSGRPCNIDAMREKMTVAMVLSLLASMPTVPEKGKWTKTWPYSAWSTQGLGFNDTVRQALLLACDGGQQPTKRGGLKARTRTRATTTATMAWTSTLRPFALSGRAERNSSRPNPRANTIWS